MPTDVMQLIAQPALAGSPDDVVRATDVAPVEPEAGGSWVPALAEALARLRVSVEATSEAVGDGVSVGAVHDRDPRIADRSSRLAAVRSEHRFGLGPTPPPQSERGIPDGGTFEILAGFDLDPAVEGDVVEKIEPPALRTSRVPGAPLGRAFEPMAPPADAATPDPPGTRKVAAEETSLSDPVPLGQERAATVTRADAEPSSPDRIEAPRLGRRPPDSVPRGAEHPETVSSRVDASFEVSRSPKPRSTLSAPMPHPPEGAAVDARPEISQNEPPRHGSGLRPHEAELPGPALDSRIVVPRRSGPDFPSATRAATVPDAAPAQPEPPRATTPADIGTHVRDADRPVAHASEPTRPRVAGRPESPTPIPRVAVSPAEDGMPSPRVDRPASGRTADTAAPSAAPPQAPGSGPEAAPAAVAVPRIEQIHRGGSAPIVTPVTGARPDAKAAPGSGGAHPGIGSAWVEARPTAVGTSEVPVAARTRLAETILARARTLPRTGTVELRFALEPRDLGTVRVRLEATHDQLRVKIVASSQAAAESLSGGLSRLSAQLHEAGFREPEITLDLERPGDPDTNPHERGDGDDGSRPAEAPLPARARGSEETASPIREQPEGRLNRIA